MRFVPDLRRVLTGLLATLRLRRGSENRGSPIGKRPIAEFVPEPDPAAGRPGENRAGDANPTQALNSMHGDAALTDEAEDRLDRLPFAAAVADAIAHRSDRSSIVLGIYGPWGDGKTTVLNWISKRLDRPETGVVVVAFNPWLIRDEATLLPAFFATLATALGRRVGGRTDEIAGLLKRYGRVLSGISVGIPGASIDPGTTAEAIGTALADRTLEEMKDEFERILREEGRRVLVVLDDIDRLDDGEIHVVFKLVKLAAAFEGISYLLAFDDDKVAAALATRYSYGRDDRGRNEGGYDFLEKIVQVPLRLPRARKEAVDAITLAGLQSALNDAGIEVEEADGREFTLRYSQGLSPAIRSLRTAKRYANASGFALPLLKGETYPVDVLTVEGINACYPALYAVMREHPAWFLLPYEFHLSSRDDEIKMRQRDRLEQALASVDPGLREPARELIGRLFPQTEQLWSNFGAADERAEWAQQQRICSAEYFDRYFSYGVGAREVGDRELDDALEEPAEIRVRTVALAERKGDAGLEPLLRKLSRRAPLLDPARAEALIDAMVDIGPRVAPHSRPLFGTLNLEERAASLIAELLLQVPTGPDRIRVAARIVARAEPLPFAAEVTRWSGIRKSRTDEQRPLDDAERAPLLAQLAGRIIDHAKAIDRPMWLEERGLGLMYRARDGGKQEAIRLHVRAWLEHDPALVVSLLWTAAGVAYGGDLGMAIQQDLTTDKYEGLADVAHLDDVRSAVTVVRGDVPPPQDFPTVRYDAEVRDLSDPLVLEQFAWQEAHAHRLEGSSTIDPPPRAASEVKSPRRPRSSGHSAEGVARPLSQAPRTGTARTRTTPTLHDEIAAVLAEAGESLPAGTIAERIRALGRYSPPRRTTPVDARQVSARVSRPEYRRRFVRSNGKIGLRPDDS
jgi:hypothetical protein